MPLHLHIDNELIELLNNSSKAYNIKLYMSNKYKSDNNKYIKDFFISKLQRPLGDGNKEDIEYDTKFILQRIICGNVTINYLDKVILLLNEKELKFVSDYLFYSCNPLCFYSNLASYRTEDDMSYIFIGFNFSTVAAAQILLTDGISNSLKQYIKDIYVKSAINNELLYTLFNLSDDVSYVTHDMIERADESELCHILMNGMNSDFIINEFIYGDSKHALNYIHNMNISTLITTVTYMNNCDAVVKLMTYFINNRKNELLPHINTIISQIKNESIIEKLKPMFVLCSLAGND